MKKKFFIGFALGYLAGVGGSVLVYKNRRKIKTKIWELRAKAEVHQRLAKLKKFSRESYDEIIEDVLEGYRTSKDSAKDELDELEMDLKGTWRDAKRRFDAALSEGEEEDEE